MLQRLNFLFVLAGCSQIIIAYLLLSHVWSRIRQMPHGFQYTERPECSHPPPLDEPGECCQLDPFYTIAELDSCAATAVKDADDCGVLLCLLRLRGYLDGNDELLLDKVSEGLDKWASGTPFEQKLPKIKEYCMNSLKNVGPDYSCQQARLFQCMGSLWTHSCPDEKFTKTEKCETVRNFMQRCSPPL